MMFVLIVLSILPNLSFEGKLTTELHSQLASVREGEQIYVIVQMQQRYPYEEIENLSVHGRAQIFKKIAKESQRPLIDYLRQFPDKVDEIKQFWIFNGISMKVAKDIIEEIAKREDVWLVSHEEKITLPPVEEGRRIACQGIEWNIQKVMADHCWRAGYTGENILIGHIDTGCDITHSALQGKWSGKWHDFISLQPIPYDDHGHGTTTAGIICGGDGLGPFENDIGAAPGVKLVIAKALSYSGIPQPVIPAMQWMAALKADSGCNIRAISNSWGGTTSLSYWETCKTLKALEIFPVFAVGNSGPTPRTAGSPGNYPLVIGVGATNNNDSIASFSSRGPAPDSSPWKDTINWYRRDWNLIKPDISAPGVNIRSSVPRDSYRVW